MKSYRKKSLPILPLVSLELHFDPNLGVVPVGIIGLLIINYQNFALHFLSLQIIAVLPYSLQVFPPQEGEIIPHFFVLLGRFLSTSLLIFMTV